MREVSVPQPGPGEVLVKVGGAGACHSDLHLMEWPEGTMDFDLPFTLGHENAGWVEALGAGVEGLEPGEAVAVYGPWGCGRCRACRRSAENYCERQAEIGAFGGGLGLDGGMAERVGVADDEVARSGRATISQTSVAPRRPSTSDATSGGPWPAPRRRRQLPPSASSQLDRLHQREPARWSESGVSVNIHPGPPWLWASEPQASWRARMPIRRSQRVWAGQLAGRMEAICGGGLISRGPA